VIGTKYGKTVTLSAQRHTSTEERDHHSCPTALAFAAWRGTCRSEPRGEEAELISIPSTARQGLG